MGQSNYHYLFDCFTFFYKLTIASSIRILEPMVNFENLIREYFSEYFIVIISSKNSLAVFIVGITIKNEN